MTFILFLELYVFADTKWIVNMSYFLKGVWRNIFPGERRVLLLIQTANM